MGFRKVLFLSLWNAGRERYDRNTRSFDQLFEFKFKSIQKFIEKLQHVRQHIDCFFANE